MMKAVPDLHYGRLLVPLDGSNLAESVLPAVVSLALRTRARVVLIHVLETNAPPTIHGEQHLLGSVDAKAYLTAVSERLAAQGIEVETHVHEAPEGDIAASIVAHSNEFEPDLIVLCAHGPGGLRGFIAGRLGQQVLQRGTRPILLMLPGTDPTFHLRRILVPLDGALEHEGALAAAKPIARAFGAMLDLIYVVPTVGTVAGERARSAILLPTAMRAILDMSQQRGVEYLDRIVKACRAEGLQVEAEVSRGDPVASVLRRVERLAPDLLVMATHGRAGVSATLTGSVAPRLMSRVKCPLLLVRAEADAS